MPTPQHTPPRHDPFRAIIAAEVERRGLNTYDLARMSGVSHPVWHRYLSGERSVYAHTLAAMFRSLGLSIEPGLTSPPERHTQPGPRRRSQRAEWVDPERG
jgi:transcriptional regulator with XRE-family HTH domain